MSRTHASTLRQVLLLWGPVVLYMAGIFYVSSLPQPPLPPGIGDKQGHSLGYAPLGALMLRALARGRRETMSWRTVLAAAVLATLYGVSDEAHQALVPGRESDGHDLIADAVGACVGAGVLWTWGIISPVSPRSHTR